MKPSPAWQGKMARIDKFIELTPSDGEPVSQRTEAYLGYDSKNLYAIFICFDSQPKRIRAHLARREEIFDDDNVELMLDTFHDHRRAYAFFSNALGVQSDALWTEGQDFDFSFDTVFNTEGKLTDRRLRGQDGHPLSQPAFCLQRPANLGHPAEPVYPA